MTMDVKEQFRIAMLKVEYDVINECTLIATPSQELKQWLLETREELKKHYKEYVE